VGYCPPIARQAFLTGSGEELGRGLGTVLIPFALLLWGMQKCRASAERPGSNRLAFRGLMFSLGAWAFLLLQSAFRSALPLPVNLAFMAAVVVVGLWGAILGARGVAAAGKLGGAIQAFVAVLIGVGLPLVIGFGLASGWLAERRAASSDGTPRVVDVPAYGFSYRTPGGYWMELDAARLNPNAQVALGRVHPTMSFMVVADRARDDATAADLLPWLRAGIERQGAISRFEEAAHGVGSYQGVRVLAQVPAFRYVVWLHAAGGRAYALMLSTPDAAVADANLIAESDRLFSGFSLSGGTAGP
jgi:hypothetical protein